MVAQTVLGGIRGLRRADRVEQMRERHEHANETERRERELKRNRRAMARALEGRSFVGTREYDPRTERMTTTTTSTAIGRKKEEGGGEEEEEEEEEEDPFRRIRTARRLQL